MNVFWYAATILVAWAALFWPIMALIEMRRRRQHREAMEEKADTANGSLSTIAYLVGILVARQEAAAPAAPWGYQGGAPPPPADDTPPAAPPAAHPPPQLKPAAPPAGDTSSRPPPAPPPDRERDLRPEPIDEWLAREPDLLGLFNKHRSEGTRSSWYSAFLWHRLLGRLSSDQKPVARAALGCSLDVAGPFAGASGAPDSHREPLVAAPADGHSSEPPPSEPPADKTSSQPEPAAPPADFIPFQPPSALPDLPDGWQDFRREPDDEWFTKEVELFGRKWQLAMYCSYDEPRHWPEHWLEADCEDFCPYVMAIRLHGLEGQDSEKEPLRITTWYFSTGRPPRMPTIAEALRMLLGALKADGKSFLQWAVAEQLYDVDRHKDELLAYLHYLEKRQLAPKVRAFLGNDDDLIAELERAVDELEREHEHEKTRSSPVEPAADVTPSWVRAVRPAPADDCSDEVERALDAEGPSSDIRPTGSDEPDGIPEPSADGTPSRPTPAAVAPPKPRPAVWPDPDDGWIMEVLVLFGRECRFCMYCDYEEPESWPAHWQKEIYPWGVTILWYGLDGMLRLDQVPLRITAWYLQKGSPSREPTIAEVLYALIRSLTAEGRSFWSWAEIEEITVDSEGHAYLWYLQMLQTVPLVRAFFNNDSGLIAEVLRAIEEPELPYGDGDQLRDSEDPGDPGPPSAIRPKPDPEDPEDPDSSA